MANVIILVFFLLLIPSVYTQGAHAAGEDPPGPDRYVIYTQKYMKYIWWVVRWDNGEIACWIDVDHAGIPVAEEILNYCGEEIFELWQSTPPCVPKEEDESKCWGLYLHLVGEEPASRIVSEQLIPPVVWITSLGCVPYASTLRCTNLPRIVLIGEEPEKRFSILRLEGSIDGEYFVCSPTCTIALPPTGKEGVLLRFWAYSSYGDSSEVFSARIRIQKNDDPFDPVYYLDVLSSQWRGAPLAPCMEIWNVWPPVGGLDGWLSSPETSSELATDYPYTYLAGQLISIGLVDASVCADGGLLGSGYASSCGYEKAQYAVKEWQNRFDDQIFSASYEIGIPGRLLKNLIGRESQFWPGAAKEQPEAGLGQMTLMGADSLFLWNRPFFEQFCPQVLDNMLCKQGYPFLKEEFRTALQQALIRQMDASCVGCELGIDLKKAEASISILAEALLANCAQTAKVLELNYPGTIPTYQDFWRFTLVNYSSGSGCLGLAVNEIKTAGDPLDWEHVSSHFTPVCQGAVDYVNDISAPMP